MRSDATPQVTVHGKLVDEISDIKSERHVFQYHVDILKSDKNLSHSYDREIHLYHANINNKQKTNNVPTTNIIKQPNDNKIQKPTQKTQHKPTTTPISQTTSRTKNKLIAADKQIPSPLFNLVTYSSRLLKKCPSQTFTIRLCQQYIKKFGLRVLLVLTAGLIIYFSSGTMQKTAQITPAKIPVTHTETTTTPKQDYHAVIKKNPEGITITIEGPEYSEVMTKLPPGYHPLVMGNKIVHVVTTGNTLWFIAMRYIKNPYRYPELVRLNNIKNPDLIYPGDRVIIQYIHKP